MLEADIATLMEDSRIRERELVQQGISTKQDPIDDV